MKRETIRTILVTIILIIGGVWAIRFFVVEPYRVPSGQMENTLLPGDQLWVAKWSLRWGNRTPAYRDLLVFELPPLLQTQTAVTEVGVARCIGLPGDTIRSTGNQLFINRRAVAQPPLILEAYLSPDSMRNDVNRTLRRNGIQLVEQGSVGSNRLLFLSRYDYEKVRKMLTPDSLLYPVFLQRDRYEIVLPARGESIRVTPQNAKWLAHLLNEYENCPVTCRDGKIYKEGHEVTRCRLTRDYYWVVGDNRAGLADSRTFGPLPHSLLIGKGLWIGYSRDVQKPFWQSFRTDRFLTRPL